jgi:glycosyltransferase involved in cell wall biosynthesis
MITDFYPPALGGVEQHVQSLARALVRRGDEVGVATLRYGDIAAHADDQGVRIYRLSGSAQRVDRLFASQGRPWAPPVPDPELMLGLQRVIAAERPAIVHGHDWMARSFLPLKPWSRAAFVQSLHYYTLSCAKKSLVYEDAPCAGPGMTKCIRCSARHYGAAKGSFVVLGNWLAGDAERGLADRVIAVSEATAAGNGLVSGRHQYEVIPNFVPDHDNAPALDLDPYLRLLPPGEFILFVGDLRRAKGLDVLLRAYAALEHAPPLVLIGKLWPETPTSLPPGVCLLTDWPNQAVMAAWQRTLFGVIPSVWPEPFGIVLIEAMASGRPVVASRIGGIPEIVEDGRTGLLVPPGEVEALRAGMARLLADAELRERMGELAVARAAAFREESVVPRIQRIYREAIAMSDGARYADGSPASLS